MFLFFTFLILLIPSDLLAQEAVIVEKDLRSLWKIFDEENKIFVEPATNKKVKSILWQLNLDEEIGGWMEVSAPANSYLLLNRRYLGLIDGTMALDIDSISQVLNRSSLEFTVYRKEGISPSQLQTHLYIRETTSKGRVFTREPNRDFLDFFVTASFLVLLFLGILSRRFPRDTSDYFSFLRSLSFRNREETLISTRPFNRTNVLFIIFNSALIGFLIVAMVQLTGGKVYFLLAERNSHFWQLIISWLFASGIVFAYVLIKYLLINIFSGLFRLGDFRYIQHFNSVRYTLGSFLLLFLVAGITFLASRTEGMDIYLIYIRVLVILLAVRILVLFFKLRDHSLYKNFHLFSYLCGTEIIPFVILYKLVLG